MSGRCWTAWVGVASARRAGRANATKTRSANGSACAGPTLKKSPDGRPYHRLHRRKRGEPAASSGADLVAARPDPYLAVQLQLGQNVGRRRPDLLQLLLPSLRRVD